MAREKGPRTVISIKDYMGQKSDSAWENCSFLVKIPVLSFMVFLLVFPSVGGYSEDEFEEFNMKDFLEVLESNNEDLDFAGMGCFNYHIRIIDFNETFHSKDVDIYLDGNDFDFIDSEIILQGSLQIEESNKESTLGEFIDELNLNDSKEADEEFEDIEAIKEEQLDNKEILDNFGIDESELEEKSGEFKDDEVSKEFIEGLEDSLDFNGFDYDTRIIHSSDTAFMARDVALHLDEENFNYIDQIILIFYYADNDGDGYNSFVCDAGQIRIVDSDDDNPAINPGAAELCNGFDDDCDGNIDELACECNDGKDNSDDSLIDSKDPGCWIEIDDPSTYNPYVNHEDRASIKCFRDADCGESEYTRNRYCYNNAMVMDYKRYTCSDRGTGIAKCQREVYPRLIQDCLFGCENGRCYTQENSGYVFEDFLTENSSAVNPILLGFDLSQPIIEKQKSESANKIGIDFSSEVFAGVLVILVLVEVVLILLVAAKRKTKKRIKTV